MFVLTTNSKPLVGFPNPLLFWPSCQRGRAKRFTDETASSTEQQKLVENTLPFLNYRRSRINHIKHQKLAPPIPPALDSYNGRQLIPQT